MTSELLKPALFYAIGVALQSVYETVSKDMQARLTFMGAHELKGKSEPLPVYGLPSEN